MCDRVCSCATLSVRWPRWMRAMLRTMSSESKKCEEAKNRDMAVVNRKLEETLDIIHMPHEDELTAAAAHELRIDLERAKLRAKNALDRNTNALHSEAHRQGYLGYLGL